MADTTLTGATKEIEVVPATDTKKKIIKWVLIAVAVLAAFWLVKKYLLKK
jgi:hypothetical protein